MPSAPRQTIRVPHQQLTPEQLERLGNPSRGDRIERRMAPNGDFEFLVNGRPVENLRVEENVRDFGYRFADIWPTRAAPGRPLSSDDAITFNDILSIGREIDAASVPARTPSSDNWSTVENPFVIRRGEIGRVEGVRITPAPGRSFPSDEGSEFVPLTPEQEAACDSPEWGATATRRVQSREGSYWLSEISAEKTRLETNDFTVGVLALNPMLMRKLERYLEPMTQPVPVSIQAMSLNDMATAPTMQTRRINMLFGMRVVEDNDTPEFMIAVKPRGVSW